MKRILTFLLVISSLLLATCNEDEPIKLEKITLDTINIVCDVLPSGFYNSVHMVSATTGYTISNKGRIFKTLDGGISWEEQVSGTTLNLRDIFFINEATGFIVGGSNGDGVILRTLNGGESWWLKNVPIINSFSAIHFINNTTGFCVAPGNLLRTTDGGGTWDKIELPKHYVMWDINFFDEKTGIISGNPSSLRTIDGGITWQELSNKNVRGEIQIVDQKTAYLHSSYSVYSTTDAGKSWAVIHDLPSINAVHFFNENQAVALGFRFPSGFFYSNGLVYLTNNKFRNWNEEIMNTPEFYQLNSLSFQTDSTAIAVGHTAMGCVVQLKFSK